MSTIAPDAQTSFTLETPEELKSWFLLDPDVHFLNHGSFGATPKPVFEAYQAWQREIERQPVAFIGRRQEGLLDAARARLATFLHANPEDVTFVVNATSGLNVIARSIRLEPGDEVLTTNLEYGALDMTWEYLCQKSGARYVSQEIPVPFTTSEAVIEALWQGVTPKTKAIFLSHITSATATILPVPEICARARAEGILTIIDGAHAPGQIDLDMEAIGADFYSGNCHKWMMTPKGSAFLYARPEHHDWIESLTISWGWGRGGNTFVTRNQQQGTRDVSAFLSVPTAIDFMEQHHWPQVRERAHRMLAELRARVHPRLGTTPFYGGSADDDATWYNQLGLITIPTIEDPGAFQARLLETYNIEIPVTTHGENWTFVRVAVQGYVTQADLDALEAALVAEFAS